MFLRLLTSLFGEDLATSKKFRTTVAGLVLAVVALVGLRGVNETLALEIASGIAALVAVLVHAQGKTDQGKEAAKESRPPTPRDLAPPAAPSAPPKDEA